MLFSSTVFPFEDSEDMLLSSGFQLERKPSELFCITVN